MRFTVTVLDIFPEGSPRGNFAETPKQWKGLNLAQAWEKAEKAARRAIAAYGGQVVKDPWGLSTGGPAEFDRPVRHCTIRYDYEWKPRRRPRHSASSFEPKTNICPECEGEGCPACDGAGEIFE